MDLPYKRRRTTKPSTCAGPTAMTYIHEKGKTQNETEPEFLEVGDLYVKNFNTVNSTVQTFTATTATIGTLNGTNITASSVVSDAVSSDIVNVSGPVNSVPKRLLVLGPVNQNVPTAFNYMTMDPTGIVENTFTPTGAGHAWWDVSANRFKNETGQHIVVAASYWAYTTPVSGIAADSIGDVGFACFDKDNVSIKYGFWYDKWMAPISAHKDETILTCSQVIHMPPNSALMAFIQNAHPSFTIGYNFAPRLAGWPDTYLKIIRLA
jgi:hypothetical protein